MNKTDKIRYAILAFMTLFTIAILVIECVDQYKRSKIVEDELTYIEDIYVDYTKTRSYYEINCINDTYRITKILINEDDINSFSVNDKLYLGLYKNKNIITIKVNDNEIISINDCHDKYEKQSKILIIIVPCCIAFVIGINVLLIFLQKKQFTNKKQIRKENENLKPENINKKVYDDIIKSIKKINGTYYCNILEKIEDENLIPTFMKAMIDYLEEDCIYVMIEEGCTDGSQAFMFYRLNNNIMMDMIYKNDKNVFKLSSDLFWYYPNINPSKDEQLKYHNTIKEYLLFNDDCIIDKKSND